MSRMSTAQEQHREVKKENHDESSSSEISNNEGETDGNKLTSSSKNKDIHSALKSLKMQDNNVLTTVENIVKENKTLHNAFLACIDTVKSLDNGNKVDIQNHLEKINSIFFQFDQKNRTIIGDFLKQIEFCRKSYEVYKQWFKDYSFEELEKSENIYYLRGHWWNFSDCSTSFGSAVISAGIAQELSKDLINMIGIDQKKLKYSFIFESAIGALHNTAKMENNRQTFREMKLADTLGNFLSYEDLPKVTMLVLLTLALVIDEDQTDLLFSHESSFDLLILLTSRAWKSNDKRYDGFSFEELIAGLAGLSKNDKVKRLLVEKGILDLLSKVLTDGNEDEQRNGGKLIWELSFDPTNKTLIMEKEPIMTALKSMSKSTSKMVTKCAQGALWVLEMGGEKAKKLKKKLAGLDSHGDGHFSQGHIMISYNWNDQKQLIKIKDSLKSSGFSVWMDIENLSGSTLQAMAEAVEGSVVVLVCMSERYKESINCRSEAEYAFSLNKTIVPLLMEDLYKPNGWLGILLGTKLYFDFSGKFSFDSKISELVKEMMARGVANNFQQDVTDGPIVKTAAPLVGKPPPPKNDISHMDIKKWILENKLEKYPSLQTLEPGHVQFLKKLSIKAPEYYYSLMMDLIHDKVSFEKLNALMEVTVALDAISL